MADPLTLLREFTKNKKQVIFDSQKDVFLFDKLSFPKSTETNFRSLRGAGPKYTIDAIWFLLQNSELSYADYVAECKKYNFPRVSLVDKRDIVSYLTGEIDSCPSIEGNLTGLSDKNIEKKEHEDSIEISEPSSKKVKTVDLDHQTLEAERKMFLERLEGPKGLQPPSTEQQADLLVSNESIPGLSSEKIQELKRKRQAKKRTEIKDEDDTPSITKLKFVELDVDATHGLVAKERLIRNRNTVLQSSKKHFTNVIDSIKREEQQKKEKQTDKHKQTYDRYQDIQEDKFWKERLQGNEPDEFQIDTRGTFADVARITDEISALSQRQSHIAKTDQHSRHNERHHNDVPKKLDRNVLPIIIVPGALTSLINLLNVREFLEDGSFISYMEKKSQGAKKETSVTVERKKGSPTGITKYQVIDNTAKLGPSDWNRVVAVFALGATWQFKNWLWTSPQEIFSRVPTFFVHYEDEEIPEIVKQWDVKILTVSKSKTKKHLAQTASVSFWDFVDDFVKRRL